jgi:hypothetical protein
VLLETLMPSSRGWGLDFTDWMLEARENRGLEGMMGRVLPSVAV